MMVLAAAEEEAVVVTAGAVGTLVAALEGIRAAAEPAATGR